MKLTTKMIGDAGEHYALSQITLAGHPAAKMPDGWEAYDLVADTGTSRLRISVKTRSESQGWKKSQWFMFDERRECDWFVFVFKPVNGRLRSWILPFAVALEHANTVGPKRKRPHERDLSWAKLNRQPLNAFEDNWTFSTQP